MPFEIYAEKLLAATSSAKPEQFPPRHHALVWGGDAEDDDLGSTGVLRVELGLATRDLYVSIEEPGEDVLPATGVRVGPRTLERAIATLEAIAEEEEPLDGD